MGKRGPKSKLTQEMADSMVAAVTGSRLFDAQVAIQHGVHPDTLRTWLKLGLREDAEEPFKSFAERYAKAQIEAEIEAVAEVRAGTLPCPREERPGDWKAAAWWLERKFPKRWNPNMQGSNGAVDSVDVETLIAEVGGQTQSLVELLKDPPPELVEAMQQAREEILAALTPQLVDVQTKK